MIDSDLLCESEKYSINEMSLSYCMLYGRTSWCGRQCVLTSWSANSSTVLRLNLRPQKLKRSSRLGPSSSITSTL